MNLSIPEIRVGPPMRCEGLAVFPLYSERNSSPKAILPTSSPTRRWRRGRASSGRCRKRAP